MKQVDQALRISIGLSKTKESDTAEGAEEYI